MKQISSKVSPGGYVTPAKWIPCSWHWLPKIRCRHETTCYQRYDRHERARHSPRPHRKRARRLGTSCPCRQWFRRCRRTTHPNLEENFHACHATHPATSRRIRTLRQVRRSVQAHPVGHRSRRDSRIANSTSRRNSCLTACRLLTGCRSSAPTSAACCRKSRDARTPTSSVWSSVTSAPRSSR